MSEAREFSVAGYEELVAAIIGRGYEISEFGKAEPTERHLVLRHDVDMSLDAALQIAKIEKRLGISAHYFVLLRTEFYNLYSAEGLAAIEKLLSFGHHVNLHRDASLYHEDELEEAAEWEAGCLQCITGTEVDMISFHRPAPQLLGRKELLAGKRHTYQPKYFEEMAYCSDSRGRWDHGHPLDLEALEQGRALQLLTHPIWWVSGDTPENTLDQFLEKRIIALDTSLAENCEVHVPGRFSSMGKDRK
ncbi:MAG TPA: hypothetical protein DCE33_14615 [Rhodospirillaceae bacterium]|nr:hypothetical protein [Rhodospirillaceae bacterium]